MPILYFLFVKIVEWLLPLAAFFSGNKKIKLFVNGRKHFFDHLNLEPYPKRYWFHCASLGEFEQAKPVIEKLKQQDPTIRIIISFFSPSGFEQKKNYDQAEAVIYLPLDTPANADKLIEVIQPKAVIFVKYEIWYFYLKALFRKNIPVYLISANFRAGQGIFSIWGHWLFKLLPQYKHIFLQNEAAFILLKQKGLINISVSGDTRYDRVLQNAANVKHNTIIETFKADKPLLILGSSWPTEENILLDFLKAENTPDYQIIIAPHDIGDKHISEIMSAFKVQSPMLYTEFKKVTKSNLMILNTIGHLSSAYYYADVAFIGGGFTGQLHNILEPLVFGVPVISGPVHSKFPEAAMAKNEGVLFETENADSFSKTLHTIQNNSLRNKAKAFISKHSGATELTVKKILA